MSKKYYLVKDVDNDEKDVKSQDGGIYPYGYPVTNYPVKILRTSPLVYGAPIIKLTPLIKANVASKIEVRSNKYQFNIEMPYFMVRPIVNDFYKYDRLLPKICDDFVEIKVVTPGLRTKLYTNEYVLARVLRKIYRRYPTKPSFTDTRGKSIGMNELLSMFDCKQIRNKMKDKCGKEEKDDDCKNNEELDDEYSPITIDNCC